jgi:hypothetical protein
MKCATMHSTNKAFKRYFRMEFNDLRDIYKDTVGKKVEVIKLEIPGKK